MNSTKSTVASQAHINMFASHPVSTGEHMFYRRCIDILRCTAHALHTSPGGLRYKAGSRPWLEGLCISPRMGTSA